MPEVTPQSDSVVMQADYIGFLKYSGRLAEDGIMDARASAKALLGFDAALRYCIAQKNAELAATDFEIPVRIQKGSWKAYIPDTVGQWILAGGAIVTTAYLSTAAKKLAENDFKDKRIKDVFKSAMAGLQCLVKTGKHLGGLGRKGLTGLKWRNNNEEVGIPNSKGEIIYVQRQHLELYLRCPVALLSEIASIVESERKMAIGVNDGVQISEEGVTIEDRAIFYVGEDVESDVLFPELAHGQTIELEGDVTRGNGSSNTIGFKYREHILTCSPSSGSIVRFKSHLFLTCRIVGRISREDERGGFNAQRPKIIFDELNVLHDQEQLF